MRWPSSSPRARCCTSVCRRQRVDTLRRAAAVHPIAALQSEWSLWSRDIEDEIVPTCRELGIGLVPFSPLGRGFLTGTINSHDDLTDQDMRRVHPRFRRRRVRGQPGDGPDRPRHRRHPWRRHPGQVAVGLGARGGPRRRADPGHEARRLPRGQRGRTAVELTADDCARLDASPPSAPVLRTRPGSTGRRRRSGAEGQSVNASAIRSNQALSSIRRWLRQPSGVRTSSWLYQPPHQKFFPFVICIGL